MLAEGIFFFLQKKKLEVTLKPNTHLSQMSIRVDLNLVTPREQTRRLTGGPTSGDKR